MIAIESDSCLYLTNYNLRSNPDPSVAEGEPIEQLAGVSGSRNPSPYPKYECQDEFVQADPAETMAPTTYDRRGRFATIATNLQSTFLADANNMQGVQITGDFGESSLISSFDSQGIAFKNPAPGDTLQSVAQEAYGNPYMWWVLAQANGVMTDNELTSLSTIAIPNIEDQSWNPQTRFLFDNGMAYEYVNLATGNEFMEYYRPAVSMLDEPEYEDNPGWLSGLSFVNGNDRVNRSDFYISRGGGNPVLPAHYWDTNVSSVIITTKDVDAPLAIDLEMLMQLPIINDPSFATNPPPPVVRAAPLSDPTPAINALKKVPDVVLNSIRNAGIVVITVRESIVEIQPELNQVPIPGWGGVTWNNSPGGFSANNSRIVIATSASRMRDGSGNLALHETAHAYDYAMGTISLSPTFESAFRSDFNALDNSDVSGNRYYTAPDAGSQGTRFSRAQSETYAECFANYYSNNANWFRDKPALLNYFRTLAPPRPYR